MSLPKGGRTHALFTAALAAFFCGSAFAADSTLIRTGTHTDFAFDTNSRILYISGTDSLQRYDMSTQQFLAPIYVGGVTYGMDISPDGHYLAVANASRGATKNFIDLIDLHTGTDTRVAFDLAFAEGGTFTTAFDGNNGLLVSSRFEGSGWVPLRRYDLGTGTSAMIGNIRQNSMLTASADHSVIGVAESNISNGAWGLYHSGAANYSSAYSSGWFNYEIGVSRDGSQVAIPTYGGTFIEDSHSVIPSIGTYAGGQPIGVAYSPDSDVVYFPWAGSSYVYAYDTKTGRQIQGFNFDETFGTNGNYAFDDGRAKVSSDGDYLFVSTSQGIRFMATAPVPEPQSCVLMALGLAGLALARRRRS